MILTVTKLCDLALRWRDVGPLHIAAIDVHKAFDKVLHSCIANMMCCTKLTSEWKRILLRVLKLGVLKPMIAQRMGQAVSRGRGVCQGRVQSVLEFVFRSPSLFEVLLRVGVAEVWVLC